MQSRNYDVTTQKSTIKQVVLSRSRPSSRCEGRKTYYIMNIFSPSASQVSWRVKMKKCSIFYLLARVPYIYRLHICSLPLHHMASFRSLKWMKESVPRTKHHRHVLIKSLQPKSPEERHTLRHEECAATSTIAESLTGRCKIGAALTMTLRARVAWSVNRPGFCAAAARLRTADWVDRNFSDEVTRWGHIHEASSARFSMPLPLSSFVLWGNYVPEATLRTVIKHE